MGLTDVTQIHFLHSDLEKVSEESTGYKLR